jgi:hypothetical protein
MHLNIKKMGCCNFIGIEHDVLYENSGVYLEKASNVSFADLTIRSKDDNDFEKVLNTDDLGLSATYRDRSTSYNSLRYSNQIENAFLMTSPIKAFSFVSKSCNLKSNETHCATTLNETQISSL